MISKIHHVLDPLDVEILERAFDQAWAAFKGCETSIESDCDQALEAALHRELIEIARLYGVTESIRCIVLCESVCHVSPSSPSLRIKADVR